MQLTFERFDARRLNFIDIFDEDSGKRVGRIRTNGTGFTNSGGIEIELFDGKYSANVSTYRECWGFVRGVQCVLRHLTFATDDGVRMKELTAA
ncbi:hypothetical protein [Afipia clevelandensis]|uniref:Uncharacterized protein n=1 Tax=Afipia clevelandensis ATCC 49720 TaxID=883079 RepID=K8PHZ3_9BRAD|nr:hypothetical protein [Afipia clevelandensis]EKS40414.1 hypothetical protein HMPREF9696_00865 [Afipia clevelandensis ATCC 49720]